MKTTIGVCLFELVLALTAVAADPDYPLDRALDGPKSVYTEQIVAALRSWPPRAYPFRETAGAGANPVGLRCLLTEGRPTYVGIEQWMLVRAPINAVKLILDDFANYKRLFFGFDDVKVLRADRNLSILYWEQHIPVLPNISYEMNYLMGQLPSGAFVYRYQLHEGRSVKHSDGLIVLERGAEAGTTQYTEIDFFDADWGMLSLSKERVWRESIEGIYLSDVAIRLKAENPVWDYDRVRAESKSALARFPVDRCHSGAVPAAKAFAP